MAGVLVAAVATFVLVVHIVEIQKRYELPGFGLVPDEGGRTGVAPPEIVVEQAGEGRLRVVVAPVVSPERSLYLYRDLVAYVAAYVGLAPQLLPRASYAEVNAMVRHHLADVAFVCSREATSVESG